MSLGDHQGQHTSHVTRWIAAKENTYTMYCHKQSTWRDEQGPTEQPAGAWSVFLSASGAMLGDLRGSCTVAVLPASISSAVSVQAPSMWPPGCRGCAGSLPHVLLGAHRWLLTKAIHFLFINFGVCRSVCF